MISKDHTTNTRTQNTTVVAKGNYTITAKASQLPYETDPSDNILTDGWIFITITGDVNGDRKVNVKDIFAVAKKFGQENP